MVGIGISTKSIAKPLYLMALPNIIEAIPNDEKKPVKKRQNDDKTLFGSKSQGWKKSLNGDEDDENNEEVEETMSIYLMSSKVESALKNWKKTGLVVQAGALVGESITDDTSSSTLLSLEPMGISCMLNCISKDHIEYLNKEDFLSLLVLAVRVSDAMELDDILDDDSLSENSREKINNIYMNNRNQSNSMMQIIITIQKDNHDDSDGNVNPNSEKRRLSKADRKKLKKGVFGNIGSTKETIAVKKNANETEDENAREMALILTIIDDDDDTFVKISISKEVAESYISALKQIIM
jgi:hypothetical protein